MYSKFPSLRLPNIGRIGGRLWVIAGCLFGLLGVALIGYVVFCLSTIPYNGGLVVEATPSALQVEANDGRVIGTRGTFKGDKLAAADLPATLKNAIVAIEDRRFYSHSGLDLRGMGRAAFRNITAGGTREGASTITQQLVRMLFLSQERTFHRKVQEAMLAVWLEQHQSKDDILATYINTAYFGGGVYGGDAAAKRYFGKPAKDLTLLEAAMLAGLVRAPSQLAPHRNLNGAMGRASLVLDAMVENGAITAAQAADARKNPPQLRVPAETPEGSNYFLDLVSTETRRVVGGGPPDLTAKTTLDPALQNIAESVIARVLDSQGNAKQVSQAALVAIAPDGAIRAMVGGRDYSESQFNRVTQGKRQAGSLFKLFVYLAALRSGARPDSMVVDRPTQIGEWEPENYGGRYRGAVTLRTAFANSINTVAAQLGDSVGIPAVIRTAQGLGVQSPLPAVPSLALGSAEITLLEMTQAYAAVAGNVERLEPYTVRSVTSGAKPLFARPELARAPQSDSVARAGMMDLLAAVLRDGTGKAARAPGALGGKTGTTQDYRDAWFIGFTSDLTIGVWVGNDDNSSTDKVTGGSLPATIWHDVVTQAARMHTAVATPTPSSEAGRSAAKTPLPASSLRGEAEVLDTSTLSVNGQIVKLFGVEGSRGSRALRDFDRYLQRGEVECRPAGDQRSYRCSLQGQDLSELVLFNGGGRASADATPELMAIEEQARSGRAGVWHR